MSAILAAAADAGGGGTQAYLFAGLAGLITALVGGYAVYRKLPSEKRDIIITSADRLNQMTLRFSEAVDEDNVSLRQQLQQLRVEFDEYRTKTEGRLETLSGELRQERSEKESVKRENARLTARVTELETEVAVLKAHRDDRGARDPVD